MHLRTKRAPSKKEQAKKKLFSWGFWTCDMARILCSCGKFTSEKSKAKASDMAHRKQFLQVFLTLAAVKAKNVANRMRTAHEWSTGCWIRVLSFAVPLCD
jgi:hypothetical protein